MQRYWEKAKTPHEKLACEILAVAIGSHHGLYVQKQIIQGIAMTGIKG